jgi:hypothetical protein
MNDKRNVSKVIELAYKAGVTHKQNLGVYQFYEPELNEFVELIVEECIDTAFKNGYDVDFIRDYLKTNNFFRNRRKRAVFYKSEYPEDYGDEVHVTNVREGEQDSDAILRAIELYNRDISFYVREL